MLLNWFSSSSEFLARVSTQATADQHVGGDQPNFLFVFAWSFLKGILATADTSIACGLGHFGGGRKLELKQETQTRTEEYRIHLTFTTRSHESVFTIAEVTSQIYIRRYCCSTYRPSSAGTTAPPEIEHTREYNTDRLKV